MDDGDSDDRSARSDASSGGARRSHVRIAFRSRKASFSTLVAEGAGGVLTFLMNGPIALGAAHVRCFYYFYSF